MNRCLRDRTLWLMSEGEASREDQAHVASCAVCTERLQHLEQDLRQLRSVLCGPPPLQGASTRLWSVRVPWMTAATALAAMLIVVWVGLWWQAALPPMTPMEAAQEPVGPFLERVSEALFTTGEVGAVGTVALPFDLTDLQAALAGEWPCEGQDTLWRLECEDDAFPLLVGGD
jgi:hypothetical protein